MGESMKKIILNPNCSEIVFRLNIPKKETLKRLEKIGVKEIEFDCSDLYSLHKEKGEKTKELGDIDNPNIPDFKNSAHVSLGDGEWDRPEKEGIDKSKSHIYAHQHSQHQMFPTLLKIENEFQDVLEEEPFSSGGSIEPYDDWKNEEETIPNYQDEGGKEKRNRLVMQHFLKGKCSICGIEERNKSIILAEKGWKFCMECHKECCPECVKKGKIGETYFFCSQKCMSKLVADKL